MQLINSSLDDMQNIYDNEYKNGCSIHIDPSKRGTFKAQASRMGMTVQEAASHILANKGNYSPAMVKKANFARNFAHVDGGNLFYFGGNIFNGENGSTVDNSGSKKGMTIKGNNSNVQWDETGTYRINDDGSFTQLEKNDNDGLGWYTERRGGGRRYENKDSQYIYDSILNPAFLDGSSIENMQNRLLRRNKAAKSKIRQFIEKHADKETLTPSQKTLLNISFNLGNADRRNKISFNNSPMFGASLKDYLNAGASILRDAAIIPFYEDIERDTYEQHKDRHPESVKKNGEFSTITRYQNKLFESTGDEKYSKHLVDNGDGTYSYPYSAMVQYGGWRLDPKQFSSDYNTFTNDNTLHFWQKPIYSPYQHSDWLFRQAGHWGTQSKVYVNPNNPNEFMLDLVDDWDLAEPVDRFAGNVPFKTHNQIPVIKKGNQYYLNTKDTSNVEKYLKYPVYRFYNYNFNTNKIDTNIKSKSMGTIPLINKIKSIF